MPATLPKTASFQEKRRALAHDPHRPAYHFLPPANWMNDPNGLIQWQGQFHLFYQYNPNGPFHGTIHWGHAASEDLVHWRDLPIALAPTPGGPDEEGCWSGCAVNDDGVPTLVYTGVSPQVVCLATGSDELLAWTKPAHNPVIAGPPPELEHRSGGHFRDPYVWRADGRYYMVIGSKEEGVGGLILLYRSDDLVNWEYLHPLLRGDVNDSGPFWTGTMWECPNLLDFGDRQALIFSVQATHTDLLYPVYYTGRLQDHRFTPETGNILVHGHCFYAPQVMRADDGRHLMWGWLKEGRSPQRYHEAGWAGVMSAPIELSLRPDNTLGLAPVPELKALRGRGWHYEGVGLNLGSFELLADVQGDCLELAAVFEADEVAGGGLLLRRSPDGEEQTRIVYQPAQKRLVIEREQSSLDDEVDRQPCSLPIDLAPGEHLSLHILLDRSVIEVFANGRACLATRVYPSRSDSVGVGLLARDGRIRLKSLDVWEMKSI